MDAADWDARYAASELVWSRGPNQLVADECAGLPPGRAVDLACGEGRNALWLASRGWDVTAVDFSRVALDKGRWLAGDPTDEPTGDRSIDWVCADATQWRGEGYDLAVVAYFQVPAGDRRTAVRNLVEALRPGGTLLWVGHDSTNLAEGTGGPQDPAVLMTAEDLLADLEGIAVDVERAERVARVVTTADEHGAEAERTAWDCLLRLRRA
jgi:SAM-dependent methyltransferase